MLAWLLILLNIFNWTETFNLKEVQFLFPYGSHLSVTPKSSSNPRSFRFFSEPFSVVLCCAFRTIVHFDFSYMLSVIPGAGLFFACVVLDHLLKILFFAPT